MNHKKPSEENINHSKEKNHPQSVKDLKSKIIVFMRERPFVWNKTDPNYKNHKRRDQEFDEFSASIGVSVREIKRIWHVLRTNFFRTHRLLVKRYPNGSQDRKEKLWKYYTAMEFILENEHGFEKPSNRTSLSTSKECSSGIESSLDQEDEDFLYARSIAKSLKKFDPATQEIIKLKFQEIIVSHLKQKD